MAQIRHQDPYDLIDEIFSDAKARGVMHLVSEEETPIERSVRIKGREYLNFGTCSYMSLGQDERLKKAAVAFVERYGLQFSVSRGYLSSGINEMLEDLLQRMYLGRPCLVYSSTSACHISILPTLIRAKDAVILDQSVHFSVQNAAQIARTKGVPVEMIRHSNLQMLEEKLQAFGNKHKKIWYLIDGVYSMYGDVAPMKELHALMDKYEQLHLYIDDAHGMSWYGKHGAGRVFGDFGIHDRTILITTLAKGFGVVGGVAVFPDAETHRRIRVFGGPLSYSHPLSPPVTGAAIACAKIHLSDEIYRMQAGLVENIRLCSSLLEEAGLPMLSDPGTPINFACLGTPGLGMSVVQRMLDDGFYCNLSTFPVVPVKNTGLRFTIQRQQRSEDISSFVEAAARNIRIVLKEAGVNEDEIRVQFGLPPRGNSAPLPAKPAASAAYTVEHRTSISDMNKGEWDALLARHGAFDASALASLEEAFGQQEKAEERWDFDYFVIRDAAGKPVLATFFTTLLMKEDIFAPSSISEQIEEKRRVDPTYLVTRT
ncbi:MAG TPA: aminotransferase class I/II-fold pyridoxal phosphate-dependent enzyme, partial [Myxococcota bacterium]|nr:aminotransferase class I/II-fold pyridoxal phosphate-dependent enzyme [Myxococcota bacterium]